VTQSRTEFNLGRKQILLTSISLNFAWSSASIFDWTDFVFVSEKYNFSTIVHTIPIVCARLSTSENHISKAIDHVRLRNNDIETVIFLGQIFYTERWNWSGSYRNWDRLKHIIAHCHGKYNTYFRVVFSIWEHFLFLYSVISCSQLLHWSLYPPFTSLEGQCTKLPTGDRCDVKCVLEGLDVTLLATLLAEICLSYVMTGTDFCTSSTSCIHQLLSDSSTYTYSIFI